MASNPDINGLWAALLIPRKDDGSPDEQSLRENIEFLLREGISKVVLNGATGEYCLTTPNELERLLAVCREALEGRGEFLCGIGAAGARGSIGLGRMALDGGARALLLPMPHFFPYSQEDLIAFCRTIARELAGPILLYNLPKFTTPIQTETVQFLVDEVPNIIGLKDSSGTLDLLRALSSSGAARIVGDDSVLVAAMDEGVCDGVISGVAGVLPELTRFLFFERQSACYRESTRQLADLISQLSVFPTPWGLKLIAECRGMNSASFAQPQSEARVQQFCRFKSWFGSWWPVTQEILKSNSRSLRGL